ncbi:hypothetical protein BGZ83_008883 [Gryganskiella cystojenkinii]|nr:hypothetical protein BGZ83_008883 [Gryganskiella cystojenkinii]
MLFNIASAALVVLGTAAVSSAAPKHGQICQITSASNWCMMMPPKAGGDISSNEDKAIAFCTKDDAKAPGAKIFPKGFIKSAHFASGDGYVQITGQMDRDKYKLSAHDDGGQYDLRAPVGSACAGYNYYVNLIEPDSNIYCIRCCTEKSKCNTGKSTYGCKYVIPGDYSGNTSTTTTTHTKTKTTTHSTKPTTKTSSTTTHTKPTTTTTTHSLKPTTTKSKTTSHSSKPTTTKSKTTSHSSKPTTKTTTKSKSHHHTTTTKTKPTHSKTTSCSVSTKTVTSVTTVTVPTVVSTICITPSAPLSSSSTSTTTAGSKPTNGAASSQSQSKVAVGVAAAAGALALLAL